MALYSPFMAQAGATIGNAIAQKGQNRMAGAAYMGEPGAMEKLMQYNPKLAMEITQQKQVGEQQKIKQAADKQKNMQALAKDQRVFFEETMKLGGQLDTFEEFQPFIERRREMLRPEVGDIVDDLPPATPEMFEQMKKVHGEKNEGNYFTGKSEFAQISNMLIEGVKNPEFRNTPEYARAWQMANEPEIIRTPQGDIIRRPEIPANFKPPGPSAQKEPIPFDKVGETDVNQEEAPGTAKQTYLIPGTEKISADQKAYNKDYKLLKQSYDSMQNYIDVLSDLGPQMSIGPLNTVDTQKLESAYARAMLDAKETNGLGVLNGPDVGIIRKLMGDPTGLGGQIRGKSALIRGAQEAKKQITDNFSALNGMMTGTKVEERELSKKTETITLNPDDKSVTIDGKKSIFPSIEQYNAYKKAAGL